MYKCPMCGDLANLVCTDVFHSVWIKCACAQGHRWETHGREKEKVRKEWRYADNTHCTR